MSLTSTACNKSRRVGQVTQANSEPTRRSRGEKEGLSMNFVFYSPSNRQARSEPFKAFSLAVLYEESAVSELKTSWEPDSLLLKSTCLVEGNARGLRRTRLSCARWLVWVRSTLVEIIFFLILWFLCRHFFRRIYWGFGLWSYWISARISGEFKANFCSNEKYSWLSVILAL